MTIEERLVNMERELGRQKRRYRWLLGVVLLAAGGLIVPGFVKTTASRVWAQTGGTAKELRARSIVIEDENGKTRAVLAVGAESVPGLWLFDENGKTRVDLAAFKDGPRLTLYAENDKIRVGLGVLKDGQRLLMSDENGKIRVGLSALKDGPNLSLYDENGKTRIGLGALKDGSAIVLSDENGKDRFLAGKARTVTPDGKIIEYPESSLILFGPDGKVIWSAIK